MRRDPLVGSITDLVMNDRYREALDNAREAGAIMAVLAEHHRAGEDILDLAVDVETEIATMPREGRIQAEDNAALLGLLPITYRLAALSLEDAPSARVHGAEVAELCREISKSSLQSWYWLGAADILESTHVDPIPSDKLSALYRTIEPEYRTVLHAMSYLGATLQPDCLPEDALAQHVVVLSGSARFLDHATYRRITVSFLKAYWMKTLDAKSFRFRSPVMTRRELQQMPANSQGVEHYEARAILRVVYTGLNARLPTENIGWLYAK